MSEARNPTPEMPRPQGISLDELTQAFAQVMGVEPRQKSDAAPPAENCESSAEAADLSKTEAGAAPDDQGSTLEPPKEDACPLCPRTILEAMLFVGNRDNQPLSPRQAAELMRDVEVDEVPLLVDELNRCYDKSGSPYHIAGEGDGYRLTLRREFNTLRDRFHGRVREARLSQAAVDVLALVAYRQPLTSEKIHRLRGKPSSNILAHLVRRGLLRIERPPSKRRTPHYYTTDRFLQLFNLQTLDDLPRSEDPEPT
jgi:segregation and condensation protein B